jgi:tetratricopeptide (TPR) repeat protein
VTNRIATKTLAEVYLSQGDPQRALEIYHQILQREPSNTEIREAIRNLNHQLIKRSLARKKELARHLPRMKRIETLERWRERIRIIQEHRKNRTQIE